MIQARLVALGAHVRYLVPNAKIILTMIPSQPS